MCSGLYFKEMPLKPHKAELEAIYRRYNRREFVHPDPLEFLYNYDDPAEREIVGLIAALLAYGRVAQILRSVSGVLTHMGDSPREFLLNTSPEKMLATFADFKHRFQTGRELTALLTGCGAILKRRGSLQACFVAASAPGDKTVMPALEGFAAELSAGAVGCCEHLLPDPAKGSACKRLHLFLRWMVRKDDVDPGGWDSIPPSRLIVPLDTHMHNIATTLGATSRKSADARAAEEITAAFRRISPDDPVRYDFALTRLGIRDDTDMQDFFRRCGRGSKQNA